MAAPYVIIKEKAGKCLEYALKYVMRYAIEDAMEDAGRCWKRPLKMAGMMLEDAGHTMPN